jgi:hypothetical protein
LPSTIHDIVVLPVEHQINRADSPALSSDDPRSGLSVVAARTVRACAESVKVSIFLQDLLAKSAVLTREPTCSGSRPSPLYQSINIHFSSLLHVSSAASFLMNSSSQCLALSSVICFVESPPPSHRNGSVNGGNAYQPPRENDCAGGGNASHPISPCVLIWIQVRFSILAFCAI